MLHVSSLELLIMGSFIPFVLLWMKFLVNFGQIKQLQRPQRLIFCLCSKRVHGFSPMIGFPVKMFLSDCFFY